MKWSIFDEENGHILEEIKSLSNWSDEQILVLKENKNISLVEIIKELEVRPCFNSYCEKGKEVEYLDNNTIVVTDEDCHVCHGTGEVEDYCYCHSYTPSECACGAWTIEEIEQFYEYEEQFYNEDFEEEE